MCNTNKVNTSIGDMGDLRRHLTNFAINGISVDSVASDNYQLQHISSSLTSDNNDNNNNGNNNNNIASVANGVKATIINKSGSNTNRLSN